MPITSRLRSFLSTSLLASSLAVGACDAPDNRDVEDKETAGGKADTAIAEDATHVYFAQPLEDLVDADQVRGYEYAVETVVSALEDSTVGGAIPEAATDSIRDLRLEEVIPQLRADLDAYAQSLADAGFPIPPSLSQVLTPSGFMVFIGIPASASAGIGVSGGATLLGVMKLHRVTRVSKETGQVDPDYERWRIEFSPRVILRAGAGVGAGGGLGVNGGVGFIWGDLPTADSFDGTTVLASVVPLAGGVGPVVLPGLRWDGSLGQQPDNFYLMVGIETGATAKAFETHIQAGRIPELWGWLANLLGFAELAEAGDIDPLTQVPVDELNEGDGGGGKGDDTQQAGGGDGELPESFVLFTPAVDPTN